jgi:hypothetical protein
VRETRQRNLEVFNIRVAEAGTDIAKQVKSRPAVRKINLKKNGF